MDCVIEGVSVRLRVFASYKPFAHSLWGLPETHEPAIRTWPMSAARISAGISVAQCFILWKSPRTIIPVSPGVARGGRLSFSISSCVIRRHNAVTMVSLFPRWQRCFSAYSRGQLVLDLETPGNPFVGLKSIIGNRKYQEDRTFTRIFTLQDSPNWPGDPVYVEAISDGHGGSDAVDFATRNLHEYISTS